MDLRFIQLLILLAGCSGCSPRGNQSPIPSPDGKYYLRTSTNKNKSDLKTYLCVQFDILAASGKRLYTCQTHASDRMGWSIEWTPTNGVLLRSSDIGNRSWIKRPDADVWAEAHPVSDLSHAQPFHTQPADSSVADGRTAKLPKSEFEFYRPLPYQDKSGGEIHFQILNRNWNLQADLLDLRHSSGSPVRDLTGRVTKMGYMVAGKIVPPTDSKSLSVEIDLRVRLHGLFLNTKKARRIRLVATQDSGAWNFSPPECNSISVKD